MFILKLFFKAAISLAILGTVAGIIGASGCGNYVPHEPETPGTVLPGENPTGPGEEPQAPEKTYPAATLQLIKTFGEQPEYEYIGELNAHRITLEGIMDMRLLVIAAENGENFSEGTKLTLSYAGGPTATYTWYAVYDGTIADEPLEFTDDSVQVDFNSDGGLCCFIDGAQQGSYNIDLTITLTT